MRYAPNRQIRSRSFSFLLVAGLVLYVAGVGLSAEPTEYGAYRVIPMLRRDTRTPASGMTSRRPVQEGTRVIPLVSRQVVVPNCRHKTWRQVRGLLSGSGLRAKSLDRFARDEDLVQSQSVPVGTRVSTGTEIGLRLAARVPDVTNLPLREAFRRLHDEEMFQVRCDESLPSSFLVTHQYPVAGKLLVRGRAVEVVCMVPVPNFCGADITEANQRIQELGLHCNVRGAAQSGDVVFNQLPRGGTLVRAGSQVSLQPGVKAPYLLGPAMQANAELVRLGLNGRLLQTQQVPTRNPMLAGVVNIEWQSVRAGVVIPRTQTIGLRAVVYKYVAPQWRFVPIPIPMPGFDDDYPRGGYKRPSQGGMF